MSYVYDYKYTFFTAKSQQLFILCQLHTSQIQTLIFGESVYFCCASRSLFIHLRKMQEKQSKRFIEAAE